jgi:hypothetical protein
VTTLDVLDRWRDEQLITPIQHDEISALITRRRISLFAELHAAMYLGVLAVAAGLGWTIYKYARQWGDIAVLLPATALLVACLSYCFAHVAPFSRERVDTPGLAFDYVLYLGCLTFAVELGYVEYRFELLEEQWDFYLLLSSILYLGLAYRFDNRFVLSLGIATLGGWFGVRVARFEPVFGSAVRLAALAYGLVVAIVGVAVHRLRIKPHFLEAYLHVAANVILAALLSGAMDQARLSMWFGGLLVAAAAAIAGGIRFRRFAFVVYGTLWGYAGVSHELLRGVRSETPTLAYFVVSAGAVVIALVMLSRRFVREE